jgi:hypothetical protein
MNGESGASGAAANTNVGDRRRRDPSCNSNEHATRILDPGGTRKACNAGNSHVLTAEETTRACVVSVATGPFGFGLDVPRTNRFCGNENEHEAFPSDDASKPHPLNVTEVPARASTAVGNTECTSAFLNVILVRSACATVIDGGRNCAGYSARDARGARGSGSEQHLDAGSQNATATAPPIPPGNAGATHVTVSPSMETSATVSITNPARDPPRPNLHEARAPAASFPVVAFETGDGTRENRSARSAAAPKPNK